VELTASYLRRFLALFSIARFYELPPDVHFLGHE
jgi:hypothetical protein